VNCENQQEIDEYWAKPSDAERSERVMAAVLTMTKFDLAALKRAYEGSESAVAV
jgi:predicted 3-demethylubiquinone-9 3-methyltransferase (glyoxalase superfamily)